MNFQSGDVPDFDAMYRADHDPWEVESSWYERRKLAVLLAALPHERYPRAWEPGCGPGLVSEALGARVDDLVASDSSEQAIGLARARPGDRPHIRYVRSTLPDVPLLGTVDLVVVAEFLFYAPDLAGCLDAIWSVCAPGTHVVFLHWAHHPEDAFRSGPSMHADIQLDSLHRKARKMIGHTDQDFLLDVYEATA